MRLRWKHGLSLFLFFSLFLHLSIWTSLNFVKPKPIIAESPTLEFVVLDQSPNDKKKLKQIVEQNDKSFNDEIPDDAKYLSAKNQKVLKETKAREHGDFKNRAGKGGLKQSATARAQTLTRPNIKSSRGKLPTLSDLVPKFDPSVSREVKKAEAAGGQASQTNDHLKTTAESLETMLNTREFVYYSYYQRIRSQIRQYWEPSIRGKVKRIFAQGRSIASEKDHITRVVIILNYEGNLLGVQVISESGVKDLDDAAVEAFRAAEPFPNPPKGIVEEDGKIRINWDFILEA